MIKKIVSPVSKMPMDPQDIISSAKSHMGRYKGLHWMKVPLDFSNKVSNSFQFVWKDSDKIVRDCLFKKDDDKTIQIMTSKDFVEMQLIFKLIKEED